MKHSKSTGIGAAIGMLILILDGKTALSGAREGLDICYRTVIPSLFPFFVLSVLMTGSLSGSRLLKLPGKLFQIPAGCEAILIPAFFGGYPVGASAVAEAGKAGQLNQVQTNRLMTFCNQVGPSFLFGIVAVQFSDPFAGWKLWGIQIASAYLVSLCFPNSGTTSTHRINATAVTLPQAMTKALKIMATVCGWVLISRVVIAFSERWFLWVLPETAQILITGLLELTNGCCALNQIENEALRFVIGAGMLSFGGLCVTMQTVSLLSKSEIQAYLYGKGLQTAFALALAFLLQPSVRNIFSLGLMLSGAMVLILLKFRKSSSNPALLGV